MKTSNILSVISGLCIATILNTACNSPEMKIEKAKDEVAKANQDLEQARLDSAEYVKYKEEMEERLMAYGQKIEDLKKNIKSFGEDIQDSYKQNLNNLKATNEALKKNIEEYKVQAEDSWDVFKYQTNKQMDELGKSISASAQKNMNKDDKEKKR